MIGRLIVRMYDDTVRAIKARRRPVLRFGSVVSLLACDRTALTLEEGSQHLVGGSASIDTAARFVIVDRGNANRQTLGRRVKSSDVVGFRSLVTQKFVGVDFDNDSILTCWGDQMREWESFELRSVDSAGTGRRRYRNFGDFVSLHVRATYRGDQLWAVQYLRDSDGKRSMANVQHVDRWETFSLVDPEAIERSGR